MKNVIVLLIATLIFAIPASAEQFIKFGGYRDAGLVENTIPACGNGKLSAQGITSGDSFEVWDLAAGATDLVGGRLIATFDDTYSGGRVDYVASNGRLVVNVPTAGRFESNMSLVNHDCEFGSGGSYDTTSTTAFDVCAPSVAGGSASVRGGGYDESTGLYEWTCGNYNWSAEVGGIDANGVSDYDTPTTVGGNSWILDCTGDGTASNGTPAQQSVCLHAGEQIRMYSMSDVMLAADNTVTHGKIYLPSGLYHDRYCGAASDGTTLNGCPVLKSDHLDTHQTHDVQLWGQRKLVGAGADFSGWEDGRTGTFWIQDSGPDTDNDGSKLDETWTDIGGTLTSWTPRQWTVGIGGNLDTTFCARTSGSTGCETDQTAMVAVSDLAANAFGRSFDIIRDFENFGYTGNEVERICVNTDLAVSGVCSGTDLTDPDAIISAGLVQCTVDDGTRPNSISGGCSALGLGACVPLTTAVDNYQTAIGGGTLTGVLKERHPSSYGDGRDEDTNIVPGSQVPIAEVTADACTGTDSGSGVYVLLGNAEYPQSSGSAGYKAPGGESHYYDVSDQPASLFVVNDSRFFQDGGGIYDMTFQPGSWVGRDSVTATADCSDDNTEAACDESAGISLGDGWKGGLYGVSMMNHCGIGGSSGNNCFGFSVIDGSVAGFQKEVRDTTVMDWKGVASDPSGWDFSNFTLRNGHSSGGLPLIKSSFVAENTFERMNVLNSFGEFIFNPQWATNFDVRDMIVENSHFNLGMFNLEAVKRARISGVRGSGNTGVLVVAGPRDDGHIWDVKIEDVYLSNHTFTRNFAKMRTLFQRYDLNGNADFDAGTASGLIWLDNINVSMHGEESFCLFGWEGGTGDDATATNGSSRAVDDDRNHFKFTNWSIERVDVGSGLTGDVFVNCFGNQVSGQTNPSSAVSYLDTAVGPLPSWENIWIANTRQADQPLQTVTSEEAGDCGDLLQGQIVRVHDADTAGVCEDTDLDGIMDPEATDGAGQTALCKCDPAGNAGTGAWSAF